MDSASILANKRERVDQDRRWEEVKKWPEWKQNGAYSQPFGEKLTKEALGKVVDCLSDSDVCVG